MQERKKNPSAFLRNIFQILQNPQLSSIIEWAPNGNGFVIKNLEDFESEILPLYFKHKKYSSFVRQLNMYGFHKQRNSMFDNCFLHAQFKRGEELLTDIKRKPEKKKKVGENQGEQMQKESNWLSFSKELRHFLPQIADSILVKDQGPRDYQAILPGQKSPQQHYQMSSQPIDDIEEQEQEYVSKISLRGFIDEFDENPESLVRNDTNQNCSRDQEMGNDEINQSIKDECESDVNESSEKQIGFGDKLRQVQVMEQANLMKECMINYQEKGIKQAELSAMSINFLESTMDSLSGLSEVLIRQNEILRKTHPLIRKMVLNAQQNKINYLKAQIQAQNTQEKDDKKDKENPLYQIMEEEKQRLQGLIEILERQIEGLTESVLEEDVPISNTSIRFRLERNS